MLTAATEREFEPAYGWNRSDFHIANHEGAHAAVAAALGLEVYEVRMDRPVAQRPGRPDPLGFCAFEKLTGEDRWKHLCVLLAPSVLDGNPPKSPPSLDDAEAGDEFNMAVICFELGIGEVIFNGYVAFTEHLLWGTPTAKRKCKALGRALLEFGALPGDEVHRILAERVE